MKLGSLRVPDFLKAKDKKQIAAVYGLLATAPWDTALVQRDVLKIRQWFEHERGEVSKREAAVLEQSRRLAEQVAQYHDEAALKIRANAYHPNSTGSLTQEETIGLQQRKQTLDEYQKVLQRRRLETERASAELSKSLKEKIAGLQKLVHDKTAELAKELKQQGVLKEKIEEKISVSRDAVRVMTTALVEKFFPEEVQQVRVFDSPFKQPS